MKLYVASSWRNPKQPKIVEKLRKCGHEVYDFRNPEEGNSGFSWKSIDEGWQNWTPAKYIDIVLNNDLAIKGFSLDFDAMQWADACVMVLPCGRSASIEAGWFVGAGKPLFILLDEESEPELMFAMSHLNDKGVGGLYADFYDLLQVINMDDPKLGYDRFCFAEDYGDPFRGNERTREDAMEEARDWIDPQPGEGFTTGKVIPKLLSDYVCPDRILENACEDAFDDVGEVVEEWNNHELPEAAKEDFKKLLNVWAHKHRLHPQFWGVGDTEEHVEGEDDEGND